MELLKKCSVLLLAIMVTLYSQQTTACAALFAKNAEAAILAENAEASEFSPVVPSPMAHTGLTFMSFGNGAASIGNQLQSQVRALFGNSNASSASVSDMPVASGLQNNSPVGVGIVPFANPLTASAPVSSGIVAEEMPAGGVSGAKEANDDDKALFPLLWQGSGSVLGAGAGETTHGSFLTSKGCVIGFAVLLIAAGIILPLVFMSDDGGGSGSDGDSGDESDIPDGDPEIPGGGGDDDDDDTEPVPEPSSLLLVGVGLLGLFARRKEQVQDEDND